jgi:hypothetical protein
MSRPPSPGRRRLPDAATLLRLRSIYQAACYELLAPPAPWRIAVPDADRPQLLLLSAWNPGSRPLDEAVNRARDRLLAMELRALGVAAQRSRGRARDGSWLEEGWSLPMPALATAVALLGRYQQLAGVLIDAGGRRLLWRDGTLETGRF